MDDLKHNYGNDNPIPWINGLGQPGRESGELPIMSATTSHSETEGDESEIVGIY